MHKRTNRIAFFIIIGIMLVVLSGCGTEKLTATKTFVKDEVEFDATETVEISFKNKGANEVNVVMEFEDEKISEEFVVFCKEDLKDSVEFKQDGKKVTLKMSADAFKKFEGINGECVTKEEYKEALIQKGFDVKE